MFVLRSRPVFQYCIGRSFSASCQTRALPRLPKLRLGLFITHKFSTYGPLRRDSQNEPKKAGILTGTLRENIYTVPNLLTVSRIISCPLLGYAIVQDNYVVATSLLVYAGLTDLVCLLLALCSWRIDVLKIPCLFRVSRSTVGWLEDSICDPSWVPS